MSEQIYLITIALPFATVLVVFAMKYLAAAREARARILSADSYRNLAEAAAASQSQTATTLAAMQADLAQVGTRLATIEKILKEVE